MSRGHPREDWEAKAICATKRGVRLWQKYGVVHGNGCMVKPSDWNTKFKPRLGPYQRFLESRPDQFNLNRNPQGLGFTVKDVTGNETVAQTLILTQTPPRKRSIPRRSTGKGVAQKLLSIWKKAWRREPGARKKNQQLERMQPVTTSRSRSRSRSPRPQKRRPTTDHTKHKDTGGSAKKDYINLVLGNWVDTQRSKYEVQEDKGGTSCTVKTTRPDGTVRKTKALIRQAHGSLIWGRSHVLDMAPKPQNQLRWLRLGFARGDFVWTRL